MKILPISVYSQRNAECAVASMASVSNFYRSDLDYEYMRDLVGRSFPNFSKEGLDTGEMCIVLNKVGFRRVSIVSTDVGIFDYKWRTFSKQKMKETLKLKIKKTKNKDDKEYAKLYYKFLDFNKNNKLILDYEFDKYIVKEIDKNRPLLLSFNWNILFREPKRDKNEVEDQFTGEYMYHAVVVCGYNKAGVFLADSHKSMRSRRNIKYIKKGIYHVEWKYIMLALGRAGDLILLDKINDKLV